MKKTLAYFSLVLISFSAQATHNRGGEILYKRIAPFTSVVGSTTVQVYTYSITVIKYMDHGANVADRCLDTVYFGDGQNGLAQRINGIVSSTCNCGSIPCGEIIVSNAGFVVKKNVYSIIHTYAGPGSYLIHSIDWARNGGVNNIPNSGNTSLYIESQMIITASTGMNSSPVLLQPPIDRAILGVCVELNSCAFDMDGDSLSYELSSCKGENGQTISGYFLPQTGTGGSISINAINGMLNWCTPQFIGAYNLAILVKEWRKSGCNGNYVLLGYVTRDFQILVNNSTLASFSATNVSDICVKAGNLVTQTVGLNFTSAVNSKVLGITSTFTNSAAVLSPSFSNVSGTTTYSWQTNCSQARKQPYEVFLVFNLMGSFEQYIYKRFNVTVLPHSPYILSTLVDTGKVAINWTNCMNNVSGYNIYRKTGVNNWVPGSCEQGVSAASGYVLVGNAPSSATSFTDTNVWPILNGTMAHYVVTALTDDCAESRADNVQTVTLIVGIKENALSEAIKVYPNPFTEKLEIDLSQTNGSQAEISIFSNDGKLVSSEFKQAISGKLVLNTAKLNPGLYLLKIKTEAGFTYRKIVKE
jgi:hypothetical protein